MPSRPRLVTSVALVAALAAFGATPVVAQNQAPAPPAPLQALEFAPFDAAIESLAPDRRGELDELVIEATFDQLQSAMASGDLTSAELTTYYLARIRDYDVDGLQSMLELNPDALERATALDKERAAGDVRGPLHGIPVSLKGNIGTVGEMATSAGAAAMAEFQPGEDATLVAALREAGAVILGKANLSEWAGWVYPEPETAGFSALGGFPVNPYDPSLPVLGSSSGSGVGTSANLVAASVGTETAGSLIAPASANGVVGMKPSLGLVSRSGVIPLTSQTDTPGPVTRSVADAAALLTVIAGADERDPATDAAAALADTDFTGFLDPAALEGVRIGLLTNIPELDEEPTDAQLEELYKALGYGRAVSGLRAAGAEVVPVFNELWGSTDDFYTLIDNGFRLDLADYLAGFPESPISSVDDIIAFNDQDPDRYAPYGQGRLPSAAASTLTRREYEGFADTLRTDARTHIDGLLEQYDVEALASFANTFSLAYAIAGYPAVTVPTQPVLGLTFTGPYLSDGELIGYAHAFEHATEARLVPPVGG